MPDPMLVSCIYLILAMPPAVCLIGHGLLLLSFASLVRVYGAEIMARGFWILDSWLEVILPAPKPTVGKSDCELRSH